MMLFGLLDRRPLLDEGHADWMFDVYAWALHLRPSHVPERDRVDHTDQPSLSGRADNPTR
ncbi:MAG: hypothetical protein R3E46_14760 [Sedimenticolaceae bacterium]